MAAVKTYREGEVLVLKNPIPGLIKQASIASPESEWLVKLVNGDEEKFIHRSKLSVFYRRLSEGEQQKLFPQVPTRLDRIKKQHLKDPRR